MSNTLQLTQNRTITHPSCTSTELASGVQRAVDVLREHGGRQPIHGIIRLSDHVVVVLELDDDADWAKDLLLHDLHVFASLGEDRGLDKVALVAPSLAAEVHLGALLLTRVDVVHDALTPRVSILTSDKE